MWSVHPHACGEYARSRTRTPAVHRFIPTRVGNTNWLGCLPIPKPVHPHACGEYVPIGAVIRNAEGSSPRVWGILVDLDGGSRCGRFIPTRVGNTLRARRKPQGRTGSSPRVWGILFASRLCSLASRFIPTRVGNTSSSAFFFFSSSVHPHACGEYILKRNHVFQLHGSSPRVWGIPHVFSLI